MKRQRAQVAPLSSFGLPHQTPLDISLLHQSLELLAKATLPPRRAYPTAQERQKRAASPGGANPTTLRRLNANRLYEGCALLPELNAFLDKQGFQMALHIMTGAGWGDAVYVRKTPNKEEVQ